MKQMKQIVMILLVIALAGAGSAMAQTDAVTRTRAKLYAAADAQSAVQMTYLTGTTVAVTGEEMNGFLPVTVGREGGSLSGYMEAEDVERGERAARFVQAERMHYRGTELQTSNLYSLPQKDADVISDSFCLALRSVIGYREDGFIHIRARDGSTGFACLDEVEGETLDYGFEPYVRVEPMEGELTREAAAAHAREIILAAEDSRVYTGMPEVYATAEGLDACEVEMDILYYFDAPGQLSYNICFRDMERDVVYAGVTFIVEGETIVEIHHGNG